MRMRRIYLSSIAVLLLLLPATWFAHAKWFAEPGLHDRYLIAEIQRGDIEDAVTATGTLQPRDYVDVGTQVSGQLKRVHFLIGQQVKQGDLLAEIDPVVLQARVDAGRAQIQNQTAQLADKRAQVVLAEQQLQRQRNLMKEDATTTEALQTAEALLLSLKAQIAAIQAQMKQTESTLRGDEANLGYTKIYAPMSGTVVSQTAKQGQTLNANQQAPIILRIADLSTMTVQTQVSEADVSKLRLSMPAYFTTLGSQNKRWYGQLRQVNPTPTVANNVVLYDSLFDVPNEDGVLMTQMTAQVFFVVGAAKDAVIVPLAALNSAPRQSAGEKSGGDGEQRRGKREEMRSGGSAMVKVVRADGSVEERVIKIGVKNRIAAQVLEGLQPGEKVIAGLKQTQNVERASGNNQSRPSGSMHPRI